MAAIGPPTSATTHAPRSIQRDSNESRSGSRTTADLLGPRMIFDSVREINAHVGRQATLLRVTEFSKS